MAANTSRATRIDSARCSSRRRAPRARAAKKHASALGSDEDRQAVVRKLKELARVLEEALQIRLTVSLRTRAASHAPAGDAAIGAV